MLGLSKCNVVHGNFDRGRSTTDLLRNHNGHRPLGSRTSQLVNILCLNGKAQRPRLSSFREMAHSVQPVEMEQPC